MKWIILDVETTGLSAPIHVVEAAAQLMDDLEPAGTPFSVLLNHDVEIPKAVSRIHGYTREILERDGLLPAEAHRALREYAKDYPVVSYNLAYDWDEVLAPEWERLGLEQAGQRGFCALRLARRLLDPLPTSNCKLQTLRRYYELPERAAHSAEGDVLTLVDLFQKVLSPIAKQRGLSEWDDLASHADEDWYPSRITFGQYRGRDFREARDDTDLHSYLEWLSKSEKEHNALPGAWYLEHLEEDPPPPVILDFGEAGSSATTSQDRELVRYSNPEVERLKVMIDFARDRLAKVETEHDVLKAKIDKTRSRIFMALRPLYEKHDSLQLRVEYRSRFLEILLRDGTEAAAVVEDEFLQAEEKNKQQFEDTANDLEAKKELTEEEEKRLKKVHRKLAVRFHPDKNDSDPKYANLFVLIDKAYNDNDLETLEAIFADPDAFALLNEKDINLSECDEAESLEGLWHALQNKVLSVISAIDALKESPDHEIAVLSEKDKRFLDEIIADQEQDLRNLVQELSAKADKLEEEIEDLTGESL
jgi:DNA polymerase III epsilon subunit-like protein